MIKAYNEFYSFILEELEKDYIKYHQEDFLIFIENNEFKSRLSNTISKNRYDALSLIKLLHGLYIKHKKFNELEWLYYIYDYVLNFSFPEKVRRNFDENLTPLVSFFLNLLRKLCHLEMKYSRNSFLYRYPISFLNPEEERESKFLEEYLIFKEAFFSKWIYELMKLDLSLTNHNTLDHVVGVNHLSLNIGRQLKNLGLPIDLGIIVGAGLGHDIGKYGVEDKDKDRVPYLHYYYTEKWFNSLNIEKTGHIATNHSTWDLELENLPLESLVLIYADFRVKNKKDEDTYKMHIYTLDKAYSVILNKLDNLDSKKERRYEKVYKKLKDFEDYMISLGVDTSITSKIIEKKDAMPYALMKDEEIVNNIKYFAIEHNIFLMAKLLDDTSFDNILEMARSEYSWRKLRQYLQIFKEYSTYLTQRQKIVTLHFLTDLLFHKEEDIRKEAAELIGLLISQYDEEYRKETPKSINVYNQETTSYQVLSDLLNYILYPDHKVEESHIDWQYNLKTIIKSLFNNAREDNYVKYSKLLLIYYDNYKLLTSTSQLYLAQTLKYIPLDYLQDEHLKRLHKYIIAQLNSGSLEVRLTILDIIDEILDELVKKDGFIVLLNNWLKKNLLLSPYPSENYLKYKLGKKLNLESHILNILETNYKSVEENTSDIFLKNLKTATEWMNKKVNIDILYDQVKKTPKTFGLYTGMHFCNLLKVSAKEKVRNYAGHTLLHMYKFLSQEERNDIAVELLRALEMENYQFTKYIPNYLGRLLLYLQPTELDEVIDDLEEKIRQSSIQIVFLLLKTIGVCIENYPEYAKRFNEERRLNKKRLDRLLGLLLNGMASFNNEIKTEAFRIIGSHIFNSNKLLLEEKCEIFTMISKKILTLLPKREDDEFVFLSNSSSLNSIYRFILDYELNHDSIKLENHKRIAFFPGSFDPFSLSHKKIVSEIKREGFEVYLAVDEFSWSKRTQPHKFRRDIINITIAHERDVYLFPSETPINISNDKDLTKLKSLFENKDLYIVVGTDVLVNASAYKKNGLINEFNHIVFDRKSLQSTEDEETIVEKRINGIKGKVLKLSLPPQYEDISSSQIRQLIDLNRDISNLIDPLAQRYIYRYGLYLNEPQYKYLVQTKTMETEIIETIDDKLIEYIGGEVAQVINIESIYELKNKLSPTIVLVKETKDGSILGFSTLYWVKNSMLYDEFKNTNITEYLRQHAKGRMVLISGIYTKDNSYKSAEIIINETLSYCINSDYNYAIFKNCLTQYNLKFILENLKDQGFIETPFKYNNCQIFMVDMNNPITLNQDLENLLKPPFEGNQEICKVIEKTRKKLKKAVSNLYPGELLISYNRDMIYSKLIEKICKTNEVPIVQKRNKVLGPNICVPFGSILNGTVLPNTITKTMHTEKIFNTGITDFTIQSYPNYLSLREQTKVIKSFDRPVILVDDLLHKGYRLNVIVPLLKEANISIKKIIVGILTGRGQEVGKVKDIPVDCAYFVPNLKLWFNESDLYPFIGGDMVEKEGFQDYLIPSVNLILPYVSPSFIKNTPTINIYNLSETCLKNATEIFKTIERVYQDIHEKNLIVKNLGEILVSPRKPDIYPSTEHIRTLKPSACLEADLEHLKRIENLVYK